MPQFWDFHRFTTNTCKKNTHTHNCIFVEQTIYMSGFPRPICGNHPWGSHKSSVWECSLGSLPLQPSSGESIGLAPAAHEITWIMWSEWNQQNPWGVSLIISKGILAIEDGWFLHSPHQIDYRKRLRYADLATPAKSGLIRLILSLDVVGTTQWDSIEGATIHSKTIIPTNLCPERFIQAQAWFARFQVLSRKHCHATKQRDAKVYIHPAK